MICDISYYVYLDGYNRNCGGNSHYIDETPLRNAATIFSAFEIKTIAEAFAKRPGFGNCETRYHVFLFPEYQYLYKRKAVASKHNALIAACLSTSHPSDVIRIIVSFARAPAQLPLDMLPHKLSLDRVKDNMLSLIKGYFANAGLQSECQSLIFKDFQGSEFRNAPYDLYYGSSDLTCIELAMEPLFAAWDKIDDRDLWDNGREEIIGLIYDYRQFIASLLGGMGFEFAEDAFATYPFLREDESLTEEYIELACQEYFESGEDFSDDDSENCLDYPAWYDCHEAKKDNVVRRRLRRWPEQVSNPNPRALREPQEETPGKVRRGLGGRGGRGVREIESYLRAKTFHLTPLCYNVLHPASPRSTYLHVQD